MSTATEEKKYLTSVDAAKIAGMTAQKIRVLIEAGKLPAVNISATNNRPRWSIRRCDLEAFLTPAAVAKAEAKRAGASRRQRIDAGVPKVFG